jgi:hypothetical protein
MKAFLAILLSGTWISASEFLRNELFFKSYWIDHFQGLGLEFPSSMINNAVWGIWSFVLAGAVWYLSRKLKAIESLVAVWVLAFVLMWLSSGNLGVLPFAILIWAVPLSVLEVFLADWIVRKVDPLEQS